MKKRPSREKPSPRSKRVRRPTPDEVIRRLPKKLNRLESFYEKQPIVILESFITLTHSLASQYHYPHAVDDAFHALYRAVCSLHSLRIGRVKAYLRWRIWGELSRKAKRYATRFVSLENLADPVGDHDARGVDHIQILRDSFPQPDELVSGLKDEFQEVWRRLAPDERRLVQCLCKGYSVAEIARECGENINNVKSRIRRLRGRIRRCPKFAKLRDELAEQGRRAGQLDQRTAEERIVELQP
jgi:RNA polymerase sigma factor (sigma-70 family)